MSAINRFAKKFNGRVRILLTALWLNHKRYISREEYRRILGIGLPLVVSMASNTVMQFTDRVFLSGYSLESMAASGPAGLASFVPVSFFLGAVGYVNVFIAQYQGAGAETRIGPALWTGLYFCLLAGVLLASLYFLAEPLFALSGHSQSIQNLEAIYFRIMTLGGVFTLLMSVLACFFTGRGLTRPVMLVNLLVAGLNIPLDYALINGAAFFPEWGIAGAAIATVFSWAVGCGIFTWLIFTFPHEQRFKVRSAWRPDGDLSRRLLRFGLPGGTQFFLDTIFFAAFVFLVGRLGVDELAVTNIIFSINQLAFLPMIGLHIAVGTLVGQAQGACQPEQARRSTLAAVQLTSFYMGLVALAFVLWPDILLELFRPRDLSLENFALINQLGVNILRLVALYCLFDSLTIVYSGALRGAGDTSFVMKAVAVCSLGCMVIPTYLAVEVLGLGVMASWVSLTMYVCVLGVVLWRRWRTNGWETIKVIEERSETSAV